MSLTFMFSSIAEKYDFVNGIMTLGLDRVWRLKCAKECGQARVIVDVCCGTGELSRILSENPGREAMLLGLDFNKEMVKEALKKNRERCLGAGKKTVREVSFVVADVANLPLRNESVDTVSTAFGFRNLIYENAKAERHLSELLRILRANGRFVCLETSQPNNNLERTLLHVYFTRVVPIVGWLITGQKCVYDYLGASATHFKSAKEVSSMLLKSGFRQATFRHMTFGAVALFTANK
jgi:demethylmenaquinone methyltransferase/2-methoxy-6-polyprenyl-1,4-benzoquinol methylase